MIEKLKAWLLRCRNDLLLRLLGYVFMHIPTESLNDAQLRLYAHWFACGDIAADFEKHERRTAGKQPIEPIKPIKPKKNENN